MNYTLHTYPKPILCWGHGIVMGGGKGIMAGCSQRVVTENTRMAMPEITIALFPDVGGSWFLNHMPGPAVAFWRSPRRRSTRAMRCSAAWPIALLPRRRKTTSSTDCARSRGDDDTPANQPRASRTCCATSASHHGRGAGGAGAAAPRDDQRALRR
jgi:hypothetical protein